jgi:hypothetical protein
VAFSELTRVTNRSELGRAHEQLRDHGIAPDNGSRRSAVSGLKVSAADEIAELAERVSDLRANERELLQRQNDEYKSLVRDLKAGHANQGSALQHWGAAAADGIMSKGETLEMLKDATAKVRKRVLFVSTPCYRAARSPDARVCEWHVHAQAHASAATSKRACARSGSRI